MKRKIKWEEHIEKTARLFKICNNRRLPYSPNRPNHIGIYFYSASGKIIDRLQEELLIRKPKDNSPILSGNAVISRIISYIYYLNIVDVL